MHIEASWRRAKHLGLSATPGLQEVHLKSSNSITDLQLTVPIIKSNV